MTVRQYHSLKSAGKHWKMFSAEHAFQNFMAMRAVEKSFWRGWYYSALKRPWRLLRHDVSFRVFEICDDHGLPVLLAPMQIVSSTHVVHAVKTYDYQDFLYGEKSTDEQRLQAWRLLLSHLKKSGCNRLEIKMLPENGITAGIFRLLGHKIELIDSSVVTMIDLGKTDHEGYFSSLGKHAKQNVRTAYNRLKRDGHSYCLKYYDRNGLGLPLDSPDGRSALADSELLYFKRQSTRYGSHKGNGKPSWWDTICMRVFNPITLTFDSPDSVLSILYIDGMVAAFMYGFIRKDKLAIELPRLAIESDFNWYSPGLLLINETAKFFLEKHGPHIIDLCQGDEKYKLDMGGVTYPTNHLILDLE